MTIYVLINMTKHVVRRHKVVYTLKIVLKNVHVMSQLKSSMLSVLTFLQPFEQISFRINMEVT